MPRSTVAADDAVNEGGADGDASGSGSISIIVHPAATRITCSATSKIARKYAVGEGGAGGSARFCKVAHPTTAITSGVIADGAVDEGGAGGSAGFCTVVHPAAILISVTAADGTVGDPRTSVLVKDSAACILISSTVRISTCDNKPI